MQLFKKAVRFFAGQSRPGIFLEALFMVLGIALVDYYTGYEVAVFPFYAVPIVLVVWFNGERAGALICFYAAFAWFCTDKASGHHYTREWLRFWDMVIRMMFYLLVLFAPQTWLGGLWTRVLGQPLAFSFAGLVAGSVIYSLPFAIQPFRAGLAGVSPELLDVARISGASALETFWHVTLPLAWSGIAAGMVLSFAHTLGEFGVVLMLGGSIPGKTKVVSIMIYDEVQNMNYGAARAYSALLLAVAFLLILAVTLLQRRAASQ